MPQTTYAADNVYILYSMKRAFSHPRLSIEPILLIYSIIKTRIGVQISKKKRACNKIGGI